MIQQRADARQNREHLLAVARAMTKKNGVPSFNELAREAEVGVGTVYRHFADAQALLAGMAEDQLSGFKAIVDAASAHEDPLKGVESLFRAGVTLVMNHPEIAKLLSGSPADFKAMERQLERVVTRARKAKVIRSELTVSDFRRLVCGVEHAARSGEKPREAAERYVEFILAGIRRG